MLALLPAGKRQTVARQMDDAGLDMGLGKYRADRLRKALQPVDHRQQDVLQAAVLELGHDLEPELRAFVLFDPQAQDVLGAVDLHPQCQVNRLVAHQPVVADLDPKRVEHHQRVEALERPVLPFPRLLDHRVGHLADQVGTHFDPVDLLQMALDLAHRHAAGVHRHDLVVEPGETPLALLDDLRLEAAVAVTRHFQVDHPFVGDQPLAARAIPLIALACRTDLALRIAQVHRQLRAKRSLQNRLLQLSEGFRRGQVGRVDPGQELVNRLGLQNRRHIGWLLHVHIGHKLLSFSSCLCPNTNLLTGSSDVAGAIDYMLKRWPSFTRFLDDGRICLTNNVAERALRGLALGRKAWLFAGSDRGGERAALLYSLIVTAKLNDIDPQTWLADVLARIAEHPANQLDELLPWNWAARAAASKLAA